jgi:hypothetical protein
MRQLDAATMTVLLSDEQALRFRSDHMRSSRSQLAAQDLDVAAGADHPTALAARELVHDPEPLEMRE